MKDDWGEFFLLVGSSAAGLIGLLFVVATLTADIETRRAERGLRLFMTPNVFHFAIVLGICALACSPQVHADALGIVIGASAIIGLLYLAPRILSLLKPGATEHWSDVVFYGWVPLLVYLVLGFCGWAVFTGQWYGDGLAAGLMLFMLLLGIRNAWDLVSWMAPRTHRTDPNDPSTETRPPAASTPEAPGPEAPQTETPKT